MKIFDTESIENTVVSDIVITESQQFFDFCFCGCQFHVIQFKLGKITCDPFTAFGFFKIFTICGIDTGIDIQTFFGCHQVCMSDTNLCHNSNRLCITAVLFGIDLRAERFITCDLLRKFQKVVSGADTQFPPGVVIEESIGAVCEIKEDTNVGEHGNNGLAAFDHIDMFLHIDFIEFRTFHQSDLFHQFHFREFEIRNSIQDRIIHFDFCTRIKSEQRTQFNTTVFITADVIGQTAFHFHKTFDLIKRPERCDLTFFTHFFNQFITILAFCQQTGCHFDCTLCCGNLEINTNCIKDQILFCAECTLLTHQHTVICLLCIEKCQTEVKNTQCQVNIQIVESSVLTLCIRISTIAAAMELFTAGSGRIRAMREIIRNSQFRQHTEHFTGPHFFCNFFFQSIYFQLQIVFQSHTHTLIQIQYMIFRQIGILGTFKMHHGFIDPLLLIFINGFTTAEDECSRTTERDTKLIKFHCVSPYFIKLFDLVFLLFII